MDFMKSLKEAIDILKLNKKSIEKVAKDKGATTAGILILIIGGFIGGIVGKDWFLIGVIPIITIIFSFIGIGILHLIARLFGGKAEFIQLYRVLTHASILNWLSFFGLIPFLKIIMSFAALIWGIAVNFVVIREVYKLSNLKTVFVLLIPGVFFFILGLIMITAFFAINPEALQSFI